MSFLTNTLPNLALFTGSERLPLDSYGANGAQPQQEAITLAKLSILMAQLSNTLNKTMVAGTIYYSQFNVGATQTNTPSSAGTSNLLTGIQVTGVNISVGTTGGSDNWYVALYNSSGVLVASSDATTAGTASTVQQIAFSAVATINSGTYYIALQSNGTTATFKALNSPIWPLATGSQTGSAGTLATISALATTYTANVGPQASLY